MYKKSLSPFSSTSTIAPLSTLIFPGPLIRIVESVPPNKNFPHFEGKKSEIKLINDITRTGTIIKAPT